MKVKAKCKKCGKEASGKTLVVKLFGKDAANTLSGMSTAMCKECSTKRKAELKEAKKTDEFFDAEIEEEVEEIKEESQKVMVRFTRAKLRDMLNALELTAAVEIGVRVDCETGELLD